MKILVLVSAFNSLTQSVFVKLQDDGHIVSVQYALADNSMIEEVNRFEPDIIFCPYLKKYIPKEVFDYLRTYAQKLIKDEDKDDDFLYAKQDYLEENKEYISTCKENEIKVMYPEFWEKESSFHKLRYDFVNKICPTSTPERLKGQ